MNRSGPGELICQVRGSAGIITLNRPEVLNSLNLSMLAALHLQLRQWSSNEAVNLVVVRGAGRKAFCAGGDVRAVHDARGDDAFMDRVYRVEYQLDEYISRYPKPYVALMSGYTMGGGCGISVHAGCRVVTETTVLAMPEVSIGLFPDIAGSYFLSRCPGAIGLYAGLTGARMTGADAVYLGLADYYVGSDTLDDLVATLASSGDAATTLAAARKTPPASGLQALRPEIDACFERPSVTEILDALGASSADWAREAQRAMLAASPTSLEITFRAIRGAGGKSIRDCLIADFRLAQRLMKGHDYFEGTRALIIDKDKRPWWSPPSLAEVDPHTIDELFAPLETRELTFS
jgi:enoyl-CoA hydratase